MGLRNVGIDERLFAKMLRVLEAYFAAVYTI
jgi:hypothetical protein